MVSILAARDNAVVATRASADRLRVIEHDAGPRVHPMTIFTKIACWYVVCWFSLRGDAVMTANAVRCDAGMVKAQYRRKRNGEMAIVTLIARGRMIDRFSDRCIVVVTTDTVTVHFVMIHAFKRNKASRGMTGITALCGLNMAGRFGGCRDYPTLRMAVLTFAQRTCEVAAPVTVTAARREVPAVEAEAS